MAVLAFDTNSGFISTGWPMTVDNSTAQTISASRDTTATTSHSGNCPMKPMHDEDRDQQQLVGHRVEIGAELDCWLKWRAMKPSTPSEMPATRKPAKAQSQRCLQHRQHHAGTSMKRRMVIRLGMVKASDRF